MNPVLAKLVQKIKDFLMAFDENSNSSYPCAMIDKNSYTPIIETRCLFTHHKELDFLPHIIN